MNRTSHPVVLLAQAHIDQDILADAKAFHTASNNLLKYAQRRAKVTV